MEIKKIKEIIESSEKEKLAVHSDDHGMYGFWDGYITAYREILHDLEFEIKTLKE